MLVMASSCISSVGTLESQTSFILAASGEERQGPMRDAMRPSRRTIYFLVLFMGLACDKKRCRLN